VASIGRPTGILITALAVSELGEFARAHVHNKNVEVTGGNSAGPGKREKLSIGMPRGIGGFARAVGDTFHTDTVGGHLVNLRMALPAREEQQAWVFGVHFRFHLNLVAVGDTPEP